MTLHAQERQAPGWHVAQPAPLACALQDPSDEDYAQTHKPKMKGKHGEQDWADPLGWWQGHSQLKPASQQCCAHQARSTDGCECSQHAAVSLCQEQVDLLLIRVVPIWAVTMLLPAATLLVTLSACLQEHDEGQCLLCRPLQQAEGFSCPDWRQWWGQRHLRGDHP